MADLRFRIKPTDDVSALASNICKINTDAYSNGLIYENIFIQSSGRKELDDIVMQSIKKLSMDAYIICRIVKEF